MSPAEAKFREAYAAWERIASSASSGSLRTRHFNAATEATKDARISRAYRRMDEAREAWRAERRTA